jgi:CheY-like chemotaxis protein
VAKTILVVEDDSDARTIYREALERRGFVVLTGKNGAEGVHLSRRHRPDLILMDLRMPIMDGWAAIRYLKSDTETSGIPIWAISAFLAEEEATNRSERWGFDRLIQKPADPAEIVSLVEAYIGQPAPRPLP